MTRLPTDPAVIVCAYRGRSGHSDYDRGIRDHLADARRHPSDIKGSTYWSFRALTLAHLHLIGNRYNASCEQIDRAELAALESLTAVGTAPSGIAYARTALRSRFRTSA